MIILDKRKYERIVSELIDAKDIREVADRFSMDRVYYYHILKDISSGQRSPNFNLLKNLADRRKLSEDFIIEQSKTVLGYFIPYYEYYQSDSLDYYKTLNVPRNASEEDMRRSWIELMKSHHPDKAGAEGLDTSKKINEAYEVLSNSAKREAYDNKSLPAMPVIVPQRDMKKYYYAASVMVVVFFVVMYASGSGLIFKSKEDKERFARELEAPDMPNTVYKGDLLDSEKVDKRVSGIKPLAPAHTAERIIADEGREPEEADRGKAVVPAETAPKNPPVVNSAPADAKTELAEAEPPANGDAAAKRDETAPAIKTETVQEPEPALEKRLEITEISPEETIEKAPAEEAAAGIEKAEEKAVEVGELAESEAGVVEKEEKPVEIAAPETSPAKSPQQAKTEEAAEGALSAKKAEENKSLAGVTPEASSTLPEPKVGAPEALSGNDAVSARSEVKAVPETELAKKSEDAGKAAEGVTEIKLPEKAETPAPGTYHTVKKGESLWTIAHKFGTTTEELSRLNDLENNKIGVGEKLLILGDGIARPHEEAADKAAEVKKTEPAPVKVAKADKLPEPLIKKTAAGKTVTPVKPPVKTDITADFNPKLAESAVAIRDTALNAPEPVPAVPAPDNASLNLFVSEYVSAYKSKDIDRVRALFSPGAVENGVGISRVLDTYSSNFSRLDIINYEVKVSRVSLQNTLGLVRGYFYVTFKDQRTGALKNSRGSINWRLFWTEGAWKIQELTYKIESTNTVGG